MPEGRRVLMGCHEPRAGSGGAVRWIGGVWFGAHRGMPAGMSRCSRLCPGWAGGLRGCRGVVSSGAKRGGTGGDALRRALHVGGRRDVEGAGGTGLRGLAVSAVVGIVAWRCWGMIVKTPKRQGMRANRAGGHFGMRGFAVAGLAGRGGCHTLVTSGAKHGGTVGDTVGRFLQVGGRGGTGWDG